MADSSNSKVTIQANSVQETLMLPLYGRAYCHEHFPKTLPDQMSADIFARCDFDVSKLDFKELAAIVWAVRASVMCDGVKKFLRTHPAATIVNLGCGMDVSFAACDNGVCDWVNVDFPDVIAAREQLCTCRDRERNFACNALDFRWMREAVADPAKGLCVISAGVLMYFTADQVRSLLCAMAEAFPGGRVMFDAESQKGIDTSNRMVTKNGNNGAMMHYAVGDARKEIGPWSDRFARIDVMNRLPERFRSSKELPRLTRLIFDLEMRLGIMKFITIDFRTH